MSDNQNDRPIDETPVDPAERAQANSESAETQSPETDASDAKPAANKAEPTDAGAAAPAAEQAAAATDAQPAATTDAASAASEESPAAGDAASAASEECPAAGDAASAASEECPAAGDAASAASEESPAAGDAASDASKGAPADGDKAPAPAKPVPRKPRFPHLLRAFRTKRPVHGAVVGVIKGGYEVRLGKARAFCPHSQIDRHRQDDAESQVGKEYTFRITQIRRGGEDIVISRRAILEEGRAEEAKAVRATLIEGAITQGRVVSVADFGAFVDLGAGVLGLVHISELSHTRVRSVDEVVKVGDSVDVRVLKLKESGRVSLSMRQAVEDPWSGIESKFEVGTCYEGSVTRLADFGAFVELAKGVEALAPASEFPPKPAGWSDGLEVGARDSWMVLAVDKAARRISLALPGTSGKAPGAPEVGQEFTGKVQRTERYGVFVWLGPGCVGLMPREMTGADGPDLRRAFRIGDEVEVSVVGVEQGGRRIRLCKKGVEPQVDDPRDRDRAAVDDGKPDEPQGSFGTSLADKLRAALGDGGS